MNEIIEQILNKLFDPEKRRLATMLDNLIRENNMAIGQNALGFLFNGSFYPISTVKNIRGAPRPAIAYELVGKMESLLNDRKIINLDYFLVRQTLTTLLKTAPSEGATKQDYRNLLPDFIAMLSDELKPLGRTQQYESLHNERVLRQTDKVLEKIHVYAAGALLY